MLCLIYGGASSVLYNEMQKKLDEVAVENIRVGQQVQAIQADKTRLDSKKADYTELIKSLDEKSATDSLNRRLKYSIPTLLNKVMYVIPTSVQLTLIQNTGTKITIVAQSDRIEQIGIFIAKLNQDGILQNVVSDTSRRQDNLVVVTIEGELP